MKEDRDRPDRGEVFSEHRRSSEEAGGQGGVPSLLEPEPETEEQEDGRGDVAPYLGCEGKDERAEGEYQADDQRIVGLVSAVRSQEPVQEGRTERSPECGDPEIQ